MRINNVKGFSLIELLAVIIVLAIIALISTPIIVGVIGNTQSKSKMTSVEGILVSAYNYYARSTINPESYPLEEYTNILNSLSFAGERPEDHADAGYGVYVSSNKEIAIAVSYNGTCYKKGYTEATITTEVYSNVTCVVPVRKEALLNGSDPSYETGLIPIVYDEVEASSTYKKWVKADVYSSTWYSYKDRKWANAVLVTDATRATYVAAAPGTEVLEANILAYLVWIPRHESRWDSIYYTHSINFIPSTVTVPTQNYYIGSAFTFGTEQLNGIWVGKFETTGTGTNPTVKPNIASLRSQDVSTQFETAQKFNTYGLGTSNDAHMAKAGEWEAISYYLSASIYGKCISGTPCADVYINNSSNYLTGRSGGAVGGSPLTVAAQYPSSGSTSTNRYFAYGYYTYDGKIVEYGGATNTYASDITLGTGASTTGNIYGIYDISGGAWERMMDVYSNPANNNGYPGYSGYSTTSNSGYNGWLGYSNTLKTNGKAWPASKYYELFTSPPTTRPWLSTSSSYDMDYIPLGESVVTFGGGNASSGYAFRLVIS